MTQEELALDDRRAKALRDMKAVAEKTKEIREWLKENADPHTTVIITQRGVRVTQDTFSVPDKA